MRNIDSLIFLALLPPALAACIVGLLGYCAYLQGNCDKKTMWFIFLAGAGAAILTVVFQYLLGQIRYPDPRPPGSN